MGDAVGSPVSRKLALEQQTRAQEAASSGENVAPPVTPQKTRAGGLDPLESSNNYSNASKWPPKDPYRTPLSSQQPPDSKISYRSSWHSSSQTGLRKSSIEGTEMPDVSAGTQLARITDNYFLPHIWRQMIGGNVELTSETIPWWTTRQVYVRNFFNVPLKLEKFLLYGLLICLDSFLFIFSFLPVRCLVAILILLGKMLRVKGLTLTSSQRFDLARCTIFFLSYFLLNTLDGSYLYHLIRGQASLKLYVIFNLIEIFDKLCCSFGQDIFDYLFATMLPDTSTQNGSVWRVRFSTVGASLGAVIYTSLHSLLLFIKVVTLNVSVNAYNNSLLTLLVSSNFVELKGIVFKSFKTENVFQIACSDAVERFQILIFLAIVCVHNLNDLSWQLTHDTLWNLIYIAAIVAGMELLVDWLKHAFITRFNKMQSSIFQNFSRIIALGVIQHDEVPDSCYATSKRIGFVSLPLACVVFRVFVGVAPISGLLGLCWVGALWLALVTTKCLISLVILSMSVSILGGTSTQSLKTEKLANTYAYDKVE